MEWIKVKEPGSKARWVFGDYEIYENRRSEWWYGKYSIHHRPAGGGLQLVYGEDNSSRFDSLKEAKEAVAIHISRGSPFPG